MYSSIDTPSAEHTHVCMPPPSTTPEFESVTRAGCTVNEPFITPCMGVKVISRHVMVGMTGIGRDGSGKVTR